MRINEGEFNVSAAADKPLIACHECDQLYHQQPLPEGGKAVCVHCGTSLYKHVPRSIERALALYITSLILFLIANTFPFLSIKIAGRLEDTLLISGAWALHDLGMSELGLLVFMTSILFPLLTMLGMIYILAPLHLGVEPPHKGPVYRWTNALLPWSLVSVFMLGVLISIVKLMDLAEVIAGPAMYALVGLLVTFAAARSSLVSSDIWPSSANPDIDHSKPMRANEQQLMSCHTCGLVMPEHHHHAHCPRCQSPVHSRKTNSMTRTWALVFTACILLIPANVYPIMTVIRFGQGAPDTILSGVVKLIEGGLWGLALIVFFASIVVPVMKLIVLNYLLISVQNKSQIRAKDRSVLYRITEVVGAWSMVDIFLVALLGALVSLGAVATIEPGIGAVFFAAVVVTTMFAAHSFDPRLIWDEISTKDATA